MNMPIFDTHFHIIDFRFPVSENQGFMPPSFPVEDASTWMCPPRSRH